MSLDISLYRRKIQSYDDGETFENVEELVFDANITHNLGDMARAAGLYKALWRPYQLVEGYNIAEGDYDSEYEFEENNVVVAKDLIDIIGKGLEELKSKPEVYKKLNSPNGWGTYKYFVPFVEECLDACIKYPDAIVKCDR